jgi:hypothetical protein
MENKKNKIPFLVVVTGLLYKVAKILVIPPVDRYLKKYQTPDVKNLPNQDKIKITMLGGMYASMLILFTLVTIPVTIFELGFFLSLFLIGISKLTGLYVIPYEDLFFEIAPYYAVIYIITLIVLIFNRKK